MERRENTSVVGPLGIEPSLPVPKTGVLPVYDGPQCLFKVSYLRCRINALQHLQRATAPVAQWIEQGSSKALMGVRFPPGAHYKKTTGPENAGTQKSEYAPPEEEEEIGAAIALMSFRHPEGTRITMLEESAPRASELVQADEYHDYLFERLVIECFVPGPVSLLLKKEKVRRVVTAIRHAISAPRRAEVVESSAGENVLVWLQSCDHRPVVLCGSAPIDPLDPEQTDQDRKGFFKRGNAENAQEVYPAHS